MKQETAAISAPADSDMKLEMTAALISYYQVTAAISAPAGGQRHEAGDDSGINVLWSGDSGDLSPGGQRHEAGGPWDPPERAQADVHREAEDDGPDEHCGIEKANNPAC